MGSLRARSPSHCHTGASLCSLLTVETLTRLWLPIQDGGLWLLPPPPWPETAGAELRLLTPLTVSPCLTPSHVPGYPLDLVDTGHLQWYLLRESDWQCVVSSHVSTQSQLPLTLSAFLWPGQYTRRGGGWRFNVQIIITDWTGSSWRSHTSWRGQSLNVLHLRHTGPDLLLAVGYPAPHLSLSLSLSSILLAPPEPGPGVHTRAVTNFVMNEGLGQERQAPGHLPYLSVSDVCGKNWSIYTIVPIEVFSREGTGMFCQSFSG